MNEVTAPEQKRKKILLVDDSPENIRVLLEVLKSDYQVVAAKDGKRALEMAVQQPQPDLILLDVLMPEMDGYEVCLRLKDDEATRDIPVIFVTKSVTAGMTVSARAYPMPCIALFNRVCSSLSFAAFAAASSSKTIPSRCASSRRSFIPARPSLKNGRSFVPARPKISCAVAAFSVSLDIPFIARPISMN